MVVTARMTKSDNSTLTATKTITIKPIPVTGVVVSGASALNEGAKETYYANISPSNASIRTVAWSVTNGTGKATISSSGVLSATAPGTVTVKATAQDGSGKSGTKTVTINSVGPKAKSLTLSPSPSYGTTFDVTLVGASASLGISNVEFYVWSKADQSDIQRYIGRDYGNGNWGIRVGIQYHNNNRGLYNVHTYMTDKGGVRKMVAAGTVSVLHDTVAPTAKAVTPDAKTTYGNAFQAYAYGVSDPSGVTSVQFAVWSRPDQSDIVWYNGVDFGNTNWGLYANIANHKNNKGVYNIHVYATDGLGNRGFVGATNVEVKTDTVAPTAKAVTPDPAATYGSTFQAYAIGVSDSSGVANVQFAVWSRPDQSDIVWYNGANFGNSNWGLYANIANHKNNKGVYNIHVYATDGMGNTGFVGATNVNVKADTHAPTAKAVTPDPATTTGNTFQAYAYGVNDDYSGVANVQFAVWSKADQSDIMWYNGANFGNSNWGLYADIANHQGNRGTYNIHVYGTDGQGNTGFIGATNVKVA